jgi:hypothetical protein
MVNRQTFLDTYSYFDKDVITEIIDIFINESGGRLTKLYLDCKEADFKSLKFDAHGLKGVIANFCAPVAWEKARDLEKLSAQFVDNNGEGFNEVEVADLIKEIEDCTKIMIRQLSAIKDELLEQV